MMLKATHNPFLYGFFKLYTRVKLKRAFTNIFIEGEVADKALPVLVIANHFSWWDGFWVMHMNRKLFGRKFYYMMLEEELRKNIFLNKIGGYSVKRGSRSIIESLRYTVDLLKNRDNLVLLFPQGKIESVHVSGFIFEKGVQRVVAEVAGHAQILFVVNLVEYYSSAKPSLYMYITEYPGGQNVEAAYNEFYASALKTHLKRDAG